MMRLGVETTADELGTLSPADARVLLVNALDAKHRPEMREMEKVVLLQILDASWMEHLRAMDHLRSSIGLQGYAQIDPKVEYKREGMRIFAEMWNGIADRVDRPDLPGRALRPRIPLLPGIALEARPGPDDPPVGRFATGRRRRPGLRRHPPGPGRRHRG